MTAPDQHKPGNRRVARIAAIITIALLVAMSAFGNHQGRIEELYGYGAAALLAAILILDEALRRAGLRR